MQGSNFRRSQDFACIQEGISYRFVFYDLVNLFNPSFTQMYKIFHIYFGNSKSIFCGTLIYLSWPGSFCSDHSNMINCFMFQFRKQHKYSFSTAVFPPIRQIGICRFLWTWRLTECGQVCLEQVLNEQVPWLQSTLDKCYTYKR